MSPKVSVVMASYNHADFVRQAVESALTQSFSDLEMVITDDGSPDRTADIIRSISDPRIDFLAFPENRGACDGINNAILRSRGEYLAILNSDDFFLPGKLARQVEFLDANPNVGAVFGQPTIVDETGNEVMVGESSHPFTKVFTKVNRTRAEWLRYFFECGNCLCHPTLMIRRACYDKVGLYDPTLMNLPDFDMWLRLCRSFDIHVMSEQLTAFRILKNERNTSAPSMPNWARVAWETTHVLGHFTELSEAELREVIAPWPETAPGRAAQVVLALAALRDARHGYCQFGLGLLRDCIVRDQESFPVKEYFRLVAEMDPVRVRLASLPPQPTHLKGFALLHEVLNRSETWWKRLF
jgi:glycosyltransferase involved in cell wall biosynthesis